MNNETKINIRTGFVAGKVKVVVCTSCVTFIASVVTHVK